MNILLNYLQKCGMLRRRLRYARHGIAGTTTEVSIIATRLYDPITPADFIKGNIQFLTTALRNAASAVNAALLSTRTSAILCIYHDKRTIVLIYRYHLVHVGDIAILTGDLY